MLEIEAMTQGTNSMPFLVFQRGHLWYTSGIICCSGSFAVQFGDHSWSGEHLWSRIICGAVTDLKILAAKNSPRFSPRFSLSFSPRFQGDLKISAAKSSLRISARFQVRSRRDSHRDIRILEVNKNLAEKLDVGLVILPRHFTCKISFTQISR